MASRILVVDDSPTIRRVVSAILERHGYEATLAADGQEALDILAGPAEHRPDLVLVDFVMPRMNGFQFCRELRARADTANMPVVLMSAKGDRIRDQFAQQTGALDAITKPFDAQALVAVVDNALRKVASGRASSARLPDLVDLDDIDATATSIDALVESSPSGSTLTAREEALEKIDRIEETRRTHVAQIVATKLAHIVSRLLTEQPALTPGALASALGEKLSKDALVEMIEVINELSPRNHDPVSILAGDLGIVPIGAVLQLLHAERQTGILFCRNGDAEIIATFREGLIDLVQSSGAGDEFRLGRFFVEEGILTPAQIDDVMARAASADVSSATEETPLVPPVHLLHRKDELEPDSSRTIADDDAKRTLPGTATTLASLAASGGFDARTRPLGMRLLAVGKIVESQLRSALTRQSSELLYELLRWRAGRFDLRRAAPGELAESARLGLPVASAVMEGFRRVDEWRLLEKTLGSFDSVLVRNDGAFDTFDTSSLPAKEKAILDSVDGDRTVRGIIAVSHGSSFDVCRVLVQLLEARVLRRRGS